VIAREKSSQLKTKPETQATELLALSQNHFKQAQDVESLHYLYIEAEKFDVEYSLLRTRRVLQLLNPDLVAPAFESYFYDEISTKLLNNSKQETQHTSFFDAIA